MSAHKDIDCAEAVRQLLAYLDGELAPERQAAMKRHLDHCRGCCSRADFELALKRRLAELGREAAPATLRARLKAVLDGF